jgi:hypothetical protein
MNRPRLTLSILLLFAAPSLYSQVEKIVIPAGTPEDQALNAIGKEQDAQKKLAMYREFLEKFASNPVAVAYGNWQISEQYQSTGDPQKAVEYGDKAVTAAPRNADILISQVTLAQQLKDNARTFKYAIQGGEAFDSIDKQAKSADLSDEEFASKIASEKKENKESFNFFENAAFGAITAETDAKTRMDYIEKFSPVFPKSKFEDQVASYAMLSLSELRDNHRLISYAEKSLAANPNSLPALLLLANTYVNSSEASSVAKAVTYAQRAVIAAKANDPDADKSRKVSAGVAHSVLGRAYANQQKTAQSITELKSATMLLKGQDEQQYAIAVYYLGWNYAKLNRLTEARAALTEIASTPGPIQQSAQDLLTKVNTARATGK